MEEPIPSTGSCEAFVLEVIAGRVRSIDEPSPNVSMLESRENERTSGTVGTAARAFASGSP